MSSMLLDYQVRKLSESIEGIREQDLVFYNTLPYTRDDVYQVSVSTKARHFRIVDEAGCEVVYDCLGTQRVYSGSYAGIRLYTMRICIIIRVISVLP